MASRNDRIMGEWETAACIGFAIAQILGEDHKSEIAVLVWKAESMTSVFAAGGPVSLEFRLYHESP